MKERKKRATYSVDEEVIKDNIENSSGSISNNQKRYSFAIRLNKLLEEKGISQEKFAEMVGASTGVISKYRNGISEPSLTLLAKMADILEVSTDYLIGKSECKMYDLHKINKLLGLSEGAIIQLNAFKNGLVKSDQFIANDESDFDDFEQHLRILSLLMEKSGFIFMLLSYIKEYLEVSTVIEELKTAYGDYDGTSRFLRDALHDSGSRLKIRSEITNKQDKLDVVKLRIQEHIFKYINQIQNEYTEHLKNKNNLAIKNKGDK